MNNHSNSLSYHLFYSPTTKVEEILKKRTEKGVWASGIFLSNSDKGWIDRRVMENCSNRGSDNLAFAYNDFLVRTAMASKEESYGYIKPDHDIFDYLNPEKCIDIVNESLYVYEDEESDSEFIKKYSKHTPLKRMMKKGELNGIIEFLCSEKSSYITGETMVIDGGWTTW